MLPYYLPPNVVVKMKSYTALRQWWCQMYDGWEGPFHSVNLNISNLVVSNPIWISIWLLKQPVIRVWSCVLSGGAPTPAGTSMFTMCTHMKCEVKHNGDMGMGHLWLIMGGTFMAYNGWDIYRIAGNFREAEIFAIFAIKRQLAKICSRENFFLQKFLADELRTVTPSTCSAFKLSRRSSKSTEKLS